MKNTLTDLNNYLFEQLERLNDDSLDKDQLERELRKTDAMVKVGDSIIRTGELAFKTMEHLDRYGYNSNGRVVPPMLETKGDWK